MPEREETKLVLSTNERIMSCIVGGEDDIMTERWELSRPYPGCEDHQHLAGLSPHLARPGPG